MVVEWLKPVLGLRHVQHRHQKTLSVPVQLNQKLLTQIDIKAIRTGRKITYSHLRKFFEQMYNNVLTSNFPMVE